MRAPAGAHARPARRQGPGERQAGARDRGRRRPQPADERPARRRQVDAGGAAALDPAAADAARTARSLDDPFGRRRAGGRRADRPAAVPRAASFGLDAGAGRRRRAAPGRARSRSPTTACCSSTNCRNSPPPVLDSPAPAARDRRGVDRPRQPSRHLSGALPARRGHEPLPLRPCARARATRAGASRTSAASRSIRRGCRGRCSTASTCTSRCRPSPPPTCILPPPAEGSAEVAARVARGARRPGRALRRRSACPKVTTNAAAPAAVIEERRRLGRGRRRRSCATAAEQHAALRRAASIAC